MRKTLSLLAAFLMTAFVAFAEEVTIDITKQGYENQTELTTLKVENVTLTFDANGNSTKPMYYTANGGAARVYANSKVTVSSEVSMTQIVFTLVLNNGKLTLETINVDNGDISLDAENNTLTWNGVAKEVTFTVPTEKLSTGGNPQFRFASLVVTLDGDAVVPEEKDPYLLSYAQDEFEYAQTGIWASLFADVPFYQSGVFTLKHYGTTEGYETWNGFAPSVAKEDAGGYQYFSCVAKGGVKGEGTPYTLAYWPEYIASSQPNVILFGQGELKAVPQEVYFCNATQTYKDITEGDYTGYVMGKNEGVEDYVLVKVRGIVAIDSAYTLTENAVDYYLADFRAGKSFVNNGWEKCDLTSLGEVYGLVFDMASTGTGEWGINTSTYFALDQLRIEEVKETEKVELTFNYGEAVYYNNYDTSLEKPTWEIMFANFINDEEYDMFFDALIESASADEIAGTYDLTDAEAELELADGTAVQLVSGTLKLELVGKEDVSDEEWGDYTIYTYKVTLEGQDEEGNVYAFDGTIDEFYYSDLLDYIQEPEVISVAEALEIIQEAGSTGTEEEYSVVGYVVKIKYEWSEQYGTATFWIDDTTAESEALQAYSVTPEQESDRVFGLGDLVMVTGQLVNYNNKTPEVNRGTYTIIQKAGSGFEVVEAKDLVKVVDNKLVVSATGVVQVYNVQGQAIYNAYVAGETTISGIQQGQVLLVRVNDKVAKVVF